MQDNPELASATDAWRRARQTVFEQEQALSELQFRLEAVSKHLQAVLRNVDDAQQGATPEFPAASRFPRRGEKPCKPAGSYAATKKHRVERDGCLGNIAALTKEQQVSRAAVLT